MPSASTRSSQADARGSRRPLTGATSERLSIGEMVRILDVASEVRRQQNELERQFRRDESRQELRERLATVGEAELSEDQLDAAIDWYYDNLHRYRKPKRSLSLLLAHLYVRRGQVLLVVVPLLLAAALVAFLWLSRGSSVDASLTRVEEAAAALRAEGGDEPRVAQVLSAAAGAAGLGPTQRERLAVQLDEVRQQLALDYRIIVDVENPIERLYGTDGNIVTGLRVVAVDDRGLPIPVPVTNATGQTQQVSTWRQEVDLQTLQAIEAAASEETLGPVVLAQKEAGSLDLVYPKLTLTGQQAVLSTVQFGGGGS